jgi:CPA2 family monovalent cation:H+ antiporter-2
MHAAHEFLKTLAIVLGVAAATTVLFQRLRQPVVLGYIIAGLVVGPHLPLPLNADPTTVSTLSELGVILLMFAIGLELNIEKLVRVAPTAGVIGTIQVALMMAAGFAVGRAFGWTQQESIFAGSAIAISSTTIIAKVFEEMKVAPSLREIVYGVLIVEDIIAIVLLATMTTVSSGSGLDAMTLALTTGKLGAFLAGMLVVGLLVVPRFMRFVVRLGRPETTLVASIGVCFVFAFACAAAHYSVALGAFVAGMLISESGEGHTVEHLLLPVRDMFAAIFFVSVGMLIDPRLVWDNLLAVVVLSFLVVVGKVVSVTLGAVVVGCDTRTSVRAGMSLAQIGEFSFIIAGLGLSLGATRPFLFPVAVAVSAITTLTTPTLIRHSDRAAAAVERLLPKSVTGFIAVYSAWLESTFRRRTDSATGAGTWTRARRLVILLTLDGAAIVGLLLGGALLHQRVEQAMAVRLGLSEVASQALVAGIAALIGLPFVLGAVRLSRAIALTVVGDAATQTEPAKRALSLAVQLGLMTMLAAVAVAVVEPFLPPAVGLLVFAVLLATTVFAFWRNARRFDVEVKGGGAAVLAALRKNTAAHASSHEAPSQEAAVPELGAPRLIRLDDSSRATGRTLGELDLRSISGAAVVAVVRDGEVAMLPAASETLRSGDLVAAIGSAEAIEAMRAFLSEGASSDAV